MSFSTSDEEALPVRTVENSRRTCVTASDIAEDASSRTIWIISSLTACSVRSPAGSRSAPGQETSVPIDSPARIERTLPEAMRSNMTIGMSLSMQRVMAVASMAFRPFWITSR